MHSGSSKDPNCDAEAEIKEKQDPGLLSVTKRRPRSTTDTCFRARKAAGINKTHNKHHSSVKYTFSVRLCKIIIIITAGFLRAPF